MNDQYNQQDLFNQLTSQATNFNDEAQSAYNQYLSTLQTASDFDIEELKQKGESYLSIGGALELANPIVEKMTGIGITDVTSTLSNITNDITSSAYDAIASKVGNFLESVKPTDASNVGIEGESIPLQTFKTNVPSDIESGEISNPLFEGAETSAKTIGETVGETVGEDAGEIAGEAIGTALDSTGILAPIGILVNIASLGFGIDSIVKGFEDLFGHHHPDVNTSGLQSYVPTQFVTPSFQAT